MKKLSLILCLSILAGCAHKTIYQQCTSNKEYENYGSLQECMSEKKDERAYKRTQKNFLQKMGEGMQNASQNKPLHCTKGYLNSYDCK